MGLWFWVAKTPLRAKVLKLGFKRILTQQAEIFIHERIYWYIGGQTDAPHYNVAPNISGIQKGSTM